ncbi:MAG: hypothetical protein AAF570_11290, partial [Bacteroidota bacterium]
MDIETLSQLYYNKNALYDLKEQVHSSRRVIPFVGAGLSIPYGYPRWGNLLRKLAENRNFQTKVEALLEANLYEYAAEIVKNGMGEFHFNKALEHAYHPRRMEPFMRQGAQKYLHLLSIGPVITTNFDCLLEATFEEAGMP